MGPVKFGIGQPMRRLEDAALIMGRGRYVDDHAPPGCLHAVIVRSPHAHARFTIRDIDAVRAMPGVRAVLTHADVADLGDLPCAGTGRLPATAPVKASPYPVLPKDTVRHVGDGVAFVVADTLIEAREAADALAIDWEPLPAVAGVEAARAPGAPAVWDQFPGNLGFEIRHGDPAGTDKAFAEAARVVDLEVVNQRIVTNYMETRGVVAEYDAATERWTLVLGSQGSHTIRDALCRDVFRIPLDRMRVITPDVGGGFGTKAFPFREYPLAAVAAKLTGKPVKWVADRSDHFISDSHGRDHVSRASVALDRRGRMLGLRVFTRADMGAYLSYFAPFIPYIGSTMQQGVYAIPAVDVRIEGVYTHSVPVDAYRGAGRPEASYLIERLVDVVAREMGLPPDEVRRRNFIAPEAMPYRNAFGRTYDSGEFAGHLARAQELADWAGFPARAREASRRGRIRGIGLGCYIEACAGGGPETAVVRIEKDGGATVFIGHQSTGQGHATAYAQIVAEAFGLPPQRVTTIQGDTDLIATGTGTGGSRSVPVGGASLAAATEKLAVKLKRIGADALETAPEDLEIVEGTVRIAGTDRAVTFADLAQRPGVDPDLLTATDAFRPPEATYPNGTHVCEVEIDPETGAVEIVGYVVVDDFGRTMNPLMLAGQVHGGLVQGLGQALLERTAYDTNGQLLSATFMDYAMPRAADVPDIVFETRNVPCRTNPLGLKGAGEAGTIGATPAIHNAVCDALARACGIRHLDMPTTPDRIWAAIHAAGGVRKPARARRAP